MSIGKFVRQEIIDLISASWSPYWGGTGGGGGGGGGGTPGAPLNSIQYNSGSSFSGSSNFTFINSSNSVYLTGSLFLTGSIRQTGSIFLSGAISASFGPNTVGFFGTASWAVSASRASSSLSSSFASTASYVNLLAGPNITINYQSNGIAITGSGASSTINGTDEYIPRFSGSSNLETSSFINRRALKSFEHANLGNEIWSGSFAVGAYNKHGSSYYVNSIGEYTQIVNNSSSFAANFGTSIDANYSVAINKYSGVAKKIRFRGYTIDPSITAEGSSYAAALVDPDATYANIIDPTLLNNSVRILIYNENTGRIAIVKDADYQISALVTCPTYTGTNGTNYRGFGIAFVTSITDIYGNAFTDAAGTNSFLVFLLEGGDNSIEANFASGLATNAYGQYNASLGNQTAAIEHANLSAGIGSITKNSGSISSGYRLGTDAKFSNNFGALNAVGRVYECQNLIRTTRTDPGTLTTYDVNIFRNFNPTGNTDVYDYLAANAHDEIIGRTDFPAIVLIPSIEYCGIVGLLALSETAATPLTPVVGTRYDILPPGVSDISAKDIYIIIPFAAVFTDTRTPNRYTYAATAIGVNNISAGSASFVGGKNSKATGVTTFAFGNNAGALNDESTAIGSNIGNPFKRSFAVGYNGINLFVSNSAVGVNSTTPPNSTYNGLYVYQDLWVNRDTTIGQNLLVSGSSFLGNDLSDFTIVTGSLIVSNSFNLIGTGRVTGSFIVSNSLNVIGRLTVSGTFIESGSYNLIGTGAATGSLIVSNSFTVIGTSTISGSNNITGSWNLTGTGRVTGSLIVSNSLNVIGTSIVTGSNLITGSWQLIGNGQTTGSLIVSNSFIVIGTNTTSGSLFVTGSQTTIGSSTVSGSIFLSGSQFFTKDVDVALPGQLAWAQGAGTLTLGLSGSLVGDERVLNIGQQQLARVYNAQGSTISKGQVVYISGSQGNRVAVKLASATAELGSANTIGLVLDQTIAAGAEGYVITEGPLYKIDTTAYTGGELLYLSTTPGAFTDIAPQAPNHRVTLGFVERVGNSTQGSIYVKIDNGYEVDELHNVLITSPTSSGDLFIRSGSVWTNSRQLTGSYGLTGSLLVNGFISASSFTGSLYGTASFALTSSGVLGGEQYRIAVWTSPTTLSSSAATDDGTLFSIARNTAVTGTFQVNVTTAVNQTQPAMGINTEGVFFIGSQSVAPTAIDGGLYYDGTDFYLGFQ